MAQTIKLLKLDSIDENTTRLQSQLMVGKSSADYILESGVLKCWGNGNKGFDFYKTEIKYTIVNNISEMRSQKLN